MKDQPIRILVVCRWPLGGIRTYLTYLYSGLAHPDVSVTFLVCGSAELPLLVRALQPLGHRIVRARRVLGREVLAWDVARLLATRKFDVIHSQGFISATHVALANCVLRVPHVLSIHGVVEDQYVSGRMARIKAKFLAFMCRNVSVFHAVGNEILENVRATLPGCSQLPERWTAIPNGVESRRILETPSASRQALLSTLNCPPSVTFAFGFFGRFMPQKGFLFLIDAVATLAESLPSQTFVVLAFGSGDYEREYRSAVHRKGLGAWLRFIPHAADPIPAMKACDAVLMPSIWEAWSLVACEALCAGVPLIASTCVGLREVTAGTPALRIPPRDPAALADSMLAVMANSEARTDAIRYSEVACARFDVGVMRSGMLRLFGSLVPRSETPSATSGDLRTRRQRPRGLAR